MHKISYNVAPLLAKLESLKSEQTGDPRFHYADSAFADFVGISRSQAIKILTGKTRRIDFGTMEALLDFFASEGMPVTISDLFVVTLPAAESEPPR
jgi:hypothetical protein